MTKSSITIRRVPVARGDCDSLSQRINLIPAVRRSGSTKKKISFSTNYFIFCSFPCTLDWAGSTVELNPNKDDDADGQRRIMHRVMEKNGRENVALKRLPDKSRRYMRDVVNTLV